MPQVSADQFQIVVDGRCCNLKICIRQGLSRILQLCRQKAVHFGHGHVIGQNGHGGENPLPDIEQMPFPPCGPEGTSVQFSDNHRTCILVLAGDPAEPFDIGRSWLGAQQFRDGVCIEKKSHTLT